MQYIPNIKEEILKVFYQDVLELKQLKVLKYKVYAQLVSSKAIKNRYNNNAI